MMGSWTSAKPEPFFVMPWPLILLDGLPERRKACRSVLERAGYRVLQALALEEAIRLAGEEKPLAIVLEASAGREVLLRLVGGLRLHPRTSRIPILVLSPALDEESGEALRPLEGVAWLPEPFTPRRLLEEMLYITSPQRSGGRAPGGSEGVLTAFAEPTAHGRSWRAWHDERMRSTWGGGLHHSGR
jgi:two-component system, OmpR family, response regulator